MVYFLEEEKKAVQARLDISNWLKSTNLLNKHDQNILNKLLNNLERTRYSFGYAEARYDAQEEAAYED